MGEFKEKNGKTRVGSFLEKVGGVAPTLLNIASSISTDGGALAKVASLIGGESNLSKDQKEEALRLLQLDYQDVQDARANETARDTSEYSSWLSKNVHELIAIAVISFWIISWWWKPEIEMPVIFEAVMLILGYLYGRTHPQQN